MSDLTKGAIPSMHQQLLTAPDFQPTVQIISVKKVGNASIGDRYRVILSDGENFVQAMFAVQANFMIEDKVVDRNSVVRLTNYTSSEVQGRRLLICLELQLVRQEADKIGSPVALDVSGNSVSAAEQQKQPQQQQIAQPTVKSAVSKPPTNSAPIYPIEGLSPYQNKWTIKARVTKKSDIKEWSNARGEGKLFSVDLMDETGEIKATGFNKTVDALYSLLEEGKVYFISRAKIGIAKKQFSNLNNEYEITFEDSTEVVLCNDTSNVPEVKFSFIELSNLESLPKDATCDVIGVVREVGELGQITSKSTQKPFSKRDLTIVDNSKWSVRVTLWGKSAESFNMQNQPVVAFRSVKVGDFGGRSLSMMGSSSMTANPDIPEAHALRGWYDSEGGSQTYSTYSNSGGGAGGTDMFKASETLTISQILNEGVGSSDKVDFYNMKATIVFVKAENLWYPACRSQDCNKKVMQDGDSWRCEKCNMSFDEPENRYIVSVNVEDHTGQQWLSGFNDFGVQLFNMTANQLSKIRDEDEAGFTNHVNKSVGSAYQFACRAKQDNYNDQARVRHSITKAVPIDYKSAAAQLVSLIAQLEQM